MEPSSLEPLPKLVLSTPLLHPSAHIQVHLYTLLALTNDVARDITHLGLMSCVHKRLLVLPVAYTLLSNGVFRILLCLYSHYLPLSAGGHNGSVIWRIEADAAFDQPQQLHITAGATGW